ncbi:MAG: hypothetical protein NWR60_04580 [Candidatus Nanopelagicales bacterium]|nr:hypothetical protein [Candidatus Nanopelagicales bacterium]MDP4825112.1 hypothetical protein [Candidatus Nanopelagicales bacterium]MDP4888440.1 hypothetical protein [Candidatus Nanopelagicales bacterium]
MTRASDSAALSSENDIWTTYGYVLDGEDAVELQTDGDGGDSQWMNQAPLRWTADVDCDVLEIPGVGHMEIVTNAAAHPDETASKMAMCSSIILRQKDFQAGAGNG